MLKKTIATLLLAVLISVNIAASAQQKTEKSKTEDFSDVLGWDLE